MCVKKQKGEKSILNKIKKTKKFWMCCKCPFDDILTTNSKSCTFTQMFILRWRWKCARQMGNYCKDGEVSSWKVCALTSGERVNKRNLEVNNEVQESL